MSHRPRHRTADASGSSRTDLVQLALWRKDGDMPIISSTLATRHDGINNSYNESYNESSKQASSQDTTNARSMAMRERDESYKVSHKLDIALPHSHFRCFGVSVFRWELQSNIGVQEETHVRVRGSSWRRDTTRAAQQQGDSFSFALPSLRRCCCCSTHQQHLPHTSRLRVATLPAVVAVVVVCCGCWSCSCCCCCCVFAYAPARAWLEAPVVVFRAPSACTASCLACRRCLRSVVVFAGFVAARARYCSLRVRLRVLIVSVAFVVTCESE